MPVSMPQFRFPFTKKAQPPAVPPTEEPADAHGPVTEVVPDATPRSHKREKSTGSISIISRNSREEDNNIYKLSVVNDSGVYLPPSPSEKKGFWGKSESSTPSSIKEVPDAEDMGFAISRESFDGYRRSFDISAKTQISDSQRQSMQSSRSSFDFYAWGRQSLDSRLNRLPSIDVSESASDDEVEFRDVDLNESAQPQKKRGFLGRFVGGHSGPQPAPQPTRYFTEDNEDAGKRYKPNTASWRREHNKDAEELSAVLKGSNHLISV